MSRTVKNEKKTAAFSITPVNADFRLKLERESTLNRDTVRAVVYFTRDELLQIRDAINNTLD